MTASLPAGIDGHFGPRFVLALYHQDTMGAGGENELDIVAWINGQLMELRYAETPRR
jgi:hypothetical protein